MLCGVQRGPQGSALSWKEFDPLTTEPQRLDTKTVARKLLGVLGGDATSGNVVQLKVEQTRS